MIELAADLELTIQTRSTAKSVMTMRRLHLQFIVSALVMTMPACTSNFRVISRAAPVQPQALSPDEARRDARVKRIYFVRHGLALHNIAGPGNCHNPAVFDPPLVRAGSKQSLLLGDALARTGAHIGVIITSPLQRAIQTAVLLRHAFVRGLSSELPSAGDTFPRVLASENAREHFSGCAADCRRPVSWAMRAFPGVDFSDVTSDADPFSATNDPGEELDVSFGVREGPDELQARVYRFLYYLRDRPEANIVVISHGSFIRHALEAALGLGFVRTPLSSLGGRTSPLLHFDAVLAPALAHCQVALFELRRSPARVERGTVRNVNGEHG